MKLIATETEVMTEHGFFVVKTGCGEALNICLNLRADERGYKKEIEGDGGFDLGTCGDANGKAIDKYGYEEVLSFLLKTARSSGIKTV